jgi:hypothetical protein
LVLGVPESVPELPVVDAPPPLVLDVVPLDASFPPPQAAVGPRINHATGIRPNGRRRAPRAGMHEVFAGLTPHLLDGDGERHRGSWVVSNRDRHFKVTQQSRFSIRSPNAWSGNSSQTCQLRTQTKPNSTTQS